MKLRRIVLRLLALTVFSLSSHADEGDHSGGRITNEDALASRCVEKRVTLNQTNWNVRASIAVDSNTLKIVRSPASNDTPNVAQQTVAELTIHNVADRSFDFAIEEGGEILWLLLERKREVLPSGESAYIIYPLAVASADKDIGKFDWIHKKEKSTQHPGDNSLCLDITQLIRGYLMDAAKRGEPISVGRGATLTSIALSPAATGGVMVSGDAGVSHAFSCHLSLIDGERIAFRDIHVLPKD